MSFRVCSLLFSKFVLFLLTRLLGELILFLRNVMTLLNLLKSLLKAITLFFLWSWTLNLPTHLPLLQLFVYFQNWFFKILDLKLQVFDVRIFVQNDLILRVGEINLVFGFFFLDGAKLSLLNSPILVPGITGWRLTNLTDLAARLPR